ncbi:MAG: hypothetical protein AAF203_10870, partial [Pseudomonadota bacterium]
MAQYQPLPAQQNIDEISKSFAFTTKLDDLIAWGRKNSLWPMPYGTACCGIELMSVMGPKYDLARFGAIDSKKATPAFLDEKFRQKAITLPNTLKNKLDRNVYRLIEVRLAYLVKLQLYLSLTDLYFCPP